MVEPGRAPALHEQLGLGQRMLILGYRADVVDYLAAADLFVLASEYEGMPVALMEALAVGLPVVGTAVGGIAESIDDSSGRTVPPGDPDALARTIVEVVSHPALLAQLGSGARVTASSFDAERSAGQIVDCYRDCLTSNSTHPRVLRGSPAPPAGMCQLSHSPVRYSVNAASFARPAGLATAWKIRYSLQGSARTSDEPDGTPLFRITSRLHRG